MMKTIAVVGLGYVGLPLAVEFGKKFRTIGVNFSAEKIACYKRHFDPTGEVNTEDLKAATLLEVGTDPAALKEADFVIVAVPTPVDDAHQPDFSPLVSSSRAVGQNLKQGAIVVYESTVYPGATEEVLHSHSRATLGQEVEDRLLCRLFAGTDQSRRQGTHRYQDRQGGLRRHARNARQPLAEVYGSVITAGVLPVSSIKVAEAAKVIENTQRDLNIALMNELAMIFDKMDIDTSEVLKAAGTKWNFLPFRPGLVGGHCIGVDPYYLTFKAETLGYHPEIILAGRRINDNMAKFIAEQTIKAVGAKRPSGQGLPDHRPWADLQGELP